VVYFCFVVCRPSSDGSEVDRIALWLIIDKVDCGVFLFCRV
jgi:hypothetical protein